MVDDDGFDDFIDMRLAGYRVLPIRDMHEGGPEADGQVVGIHHVLITVLGKARREQVPTVHPKGRSSPMLSSVGESGMPHKCRKVLYSDLSQ